MNERTFRKERVQRTGDVDGREPEIAVSEDETVKMSIDVLQDVDLGRDVG